MTSRLRSILTHIGSFALAGTLLYLALRNVDFDAVREALRTADYRWLPVLVVVVLTSHGLRAWRWQVLLEALPSTDKARLKVSYKVAFYSLMIGYMVNYVAPRMGEVARTANLSAREKLPFSGVFGTVVVERILDVIMLLMALVSMVFLLFDRTEILQELFVAPIMEQLDHIPGLALLLIMIGLAALIGVSYWSIVRNPSSPFSRFWKNRLQPMMISFKDGLATLVRSDKKGSLVFSTLAMWCCYLMMAHIPFLMFNIAEPYAINILDSWSVMILGAVGITIPSPGGLGSFHYITIESLVHLFAVDRSAAATYAVFVHGAQLILYVITGFASIILQGSSLASLRATTQAARQSSKTKKRPDTAPSRMAAKSPIDN